MKRMLALRKPRVEVWIVLRDVGSLQVLVGASMVLPLLVALLYGELYTALAFLLSGAFTTGMGLLARRALGDAGEPHERHALLIASAGWLATAVLGSLPFLLTAYLTPASVAQSFVPAGATYESSLVHMRHPLHAFFESMSAYTTTGLTMCVHEPSIGHGLLFYRSLAQWIGGAGVVVLALAVLRRPSGMSRLALYESEATGIKLRPTVVGTARAIWRIYAGLTLAVAAYLAIGTFILLPDYGIANTIFDAVNHAMTGQSTGGFSTLDDSIAGYQSYAMDVLHIPPMFLGAVAIPLYDHFLRSRDPRVLWRDAQFRTLVIVLALGTVALIALLGNTEAVSDPVREGLFQFISALTTTGWQTSSIGDWKSSAVLFIVTAAMISGGSAGATVGGVKLIRLYLVARGIVWRIRQVFLPRNAVVPLWLGEEALNARDISDEVSDAASFTLLYLALLAVSVILVSAVVGPEFTLADVIFEVVSAQSTVGLSSNITAPEMPILAEIVFLFQMWLGRLEVIPVLVLLRAAFVGLRGR